MALYIAVCDDSVADRKQLERLLSRENDSRQVKTGVIYIDSFGSREALMHTPIKYDLFFIDITNAPLNGMDIAKELRASGISAPIILCSSLIDYTAFCSSAENITCLTKPITKGQLAHILDIAIERAKTKTPLIEIRGEKEKHFINHLDLVYAMQKEHLVELSMKNGSILFMLGTMAELEVLIKPYRCFIYCKNVLVNLHHVTGDKGNSFLLTTGQAMPFSIFKRKELLCAFASFKLHSS
ncbi:MAG: response regulator [Lachnospiraceae bacterium]